TAADREGRIMTCNRAAQTIMGYQPYEALGLQLHKVLELRSPNAGPFARASSKLLSPPAESLHEVMIAGEACSGTVTIATRQGQEVVLDVDIVPLCDHLGERVGMLVTFNDVTSVHRLEEEKRRLDRLATLGEMAANVAHE